MTALQMNKNNFMGKLNTVWHEKALWVYIAIVLGHFSEHLVQVYQVYVMGWLPKQAGGVLGLWFPWLAESEVLHILYNGSMWIGIILLYQGIKSIQGPTKTYWNIALVFQSWHLFEHVILMYQYLTKNFWFGGTVQTSVGQIWFSRVELHFFYNLIVFIPLAIAFVLYFKQLHDQRKAAV